MSQERPTTLRRTSSFSDHISVSPDRRRGHSPSPLHARNAAPTNAPPVSILQELEDTSNVETPRVPPASPLLRDDRKLGAPDPSTGRAIASAIPKSAGLDTHLSSPLLKSPCFVHSHLDASVSLAQFIQRKRYDENNKPSRKDAVPEQSQNQVDDEDGHGNSLTSQLAETAIGVREMSKQLGRARVKSSVQSIMIITKARDNSLVKLTRDLAMWLITTPRHGLADGVTVYVDHQLETSKRFNAKGLLEKSPIFAEKLKYWTADVCSKSPHLFDFVITLGGDGTVLFTSWLFQRIVPPVLPFALGSLGFLTPFQYDQYKQVLDGVFDQGVRVNLRMRFTCTIYRASEHQLPRKAKKLAETGEILMEAKKEGGWESIEGGLLSPALQTTLAKKKIKPAKDKLIQCFATQPAETFEVINDLVVDRGPSPYVSQLELFGDDYHMTTVQADGLCIATPTGSTAYSLSAGGSLVHPEIPAFLITPICPHTLSFRPMLLPDSMELRICVPYNSRSTAWVSFDGRGRVELKQGDHIKITASKFPFPTVCADKQSTDWFASISRTLKWNERERQKSFVVVEEKRKSRRHRPSDERGRQQKQDVVDDSERGFFEHKTSTLNVGDEEDEVSDNDDEDADQEEEYDIDDSSPEAATKKEAERKARAAQAKKTQVTFPQTGQLTMPHHRIHHHHQRPTPSSSSASNYSSDNGYISSATSSQGSGSPDEVKAFAVWGRDDFGEEEEHEEGSWHL